MFGWEHRPSLVTNLLRLSSRWNSRWLFKPFPLHPKLGIQNSAAAECYQKGWMSKLVVLVIGRLRYARIVNEIATWPMRLRILFPNCHPPWFFPLMYLSYEFEMLVEMNFQVGCPGDGLHIMITYFFGRFIFFIFITYMILWI